MGSISQAAIDLIVTEEVTNEATYNRLYKRPTWPGEQSGVTIAIGYDIGQTPAFQIKADWAGRIPQHMLDALVGACGVTGPSAAPLAKQLRGIVDVPWDVAMAVFTERTLPLWIDRTCKAVPGADTLPPDCLGALVSLTYNRGSSFSRAGDRYREMRAIKAHVAAGDLDKIPGEIRSMKRIWVGRGVDGLLARRDREARLFERGLAGARPADGTLRYGDRGYEVTALQERLIELGYALGRADGQFGPATKKAVLAFQADRNLSTSGVVDGDTREALREEVSAPVSETRENATVQDLRDAGSRTVKQGDRVGLIGQMLLWLGIGTGASSNDTVRDTVEQVSALRPLFKTASELIAAIGPYWWVFAIGGGLAFWYFGRDIIAARLDDHTSGANMGR